MNKNWDHFCRCRCDTSGAELKSDRQYGGDAPDSRAVLLNDGTVLGLGGTSSPVTEIFN